MKCIQKGEKPVAGNPQHDVTPEGVEAQVS
jgi:hypothetical protein